MKRVSTKRRALLREVQPLRDDYRAEFPWCQWCQAMATQIHEISRGAAREASLSVRAAWLHLCADCHAVMDWLPVVAQLAIKRLADPEGYDRRKVNELRGRQPDAITEAEVDRWVRRLGVSCERIWTV